MQATTLGKNKSSAGAVLDSKFWGWPRGVPPSSNFDSIGFIVSEILLFSCCKVFGCKSIIYMVITVSQKVITFKLSVTLSELN